MAPFRVLSEVPVSEVPIAGVPISDESDRSDNSDRSDAAMDGCWLWWLAGRPTRPTCLTCPTCPIRHPPLSDLSDKGTPPPPLCDLGFVGWGKKVIFAGRGSEGRGVFWIGNH